ncbi:prepilin-type N-terminal cleavage/methylation domain-containing protein [Acidiphilium iwatense]|uniref:Prepilin-type N-terminal cleavage/methylation domain-containing protein n=1 Tax=Acidiphilium iwatense TaxID=768198 RepID=A0ABS9DSX8_9PROT|nr:prepilin-type N-terminal cleavage/methylation domain-containing protein [Acidiphilium iwatense]MCF3945774.1 prepilin-type N-terminal cleavage/methylation domain-containing protein [Acidiphilium iwatense]
MIRSAEHRGSDGFTLLEMLVVLALSGMLIAVLAGVISLGIAARARVTAVTTNQRDFADFRRILTRELGRAYPAFVVHGHAGSVDFTGTSDRMTFLAPALDAQGQGMARFHLAFARRQGKAAILIRTALATPTPGPTRTAGFARGLASLRIAYFGRPRSGGTPRWQDSWIARLSPPSLVAIRVAFPKGDRRSWPALVIHPGIDADVTCMIDVATHRCAGR